MFIYTLSNIGILLYYYPWVRNRMHHRHNIIWHARIVLLLLPSILHGCNHYIRVQPLNNYGTAS